MEADPALGGSIAELIGKKRLVARGSKGSKLEAKIAELLNCSLKTWENAVTKVSLPEVHFGMEKSKNQTILTLDYR
ncbi:MAG: hypothetical protein WAT92_16780 [Saprospiraceae bacterium]